MYVMKSTRETLLLQEKTIVTGDCCYLNPLIRRIVRFIGKNKHSNRWKSLDVITHNSLCSGRSFSGQRPQTGFINQK